MSKCTVCNSDVVTYKQGGIEIQICKKCRAITITKSNFEKLAKHIDPNCEIVDIFALEKFETKDEITRICDCCKVPMEKIYYNGVVLDRCSNCNILIFDDGELSKYFSKFSPSGHEVVNNARFVTMYFPSKDSTIEETPSQNTITQTKETKPTKGTNKSMSNDYNNSNMQIQSREEEFKAFYLPGIPMIFLLFILGIVALPLFLMPFAAIVGIVMIGIIIFIAMGLRIIKPQEAMVLTLFGKYVGSIKEAGFHWVNPFTSSYNAGEGYTISLKARTLDNGKQKINDEQGNPIEVGIMVTWEIKDTAKAIFNVNDYSTFLSAQCDSALRNIVRLYPYDASEDSDKQTLRGDSIEISEKLKLEIQKSVLPAGINIIDARITHLAYASEIAAAMLQRQQAKAIIEAKKSIVDGAVGMVEMALEKLENNSHINLDEKTKANMVNNLLVVLCANKDSQPVIRNDIL